MKFLPHTDSDISSMLQAINIADPGELFDDIEPGLRANTSQEIPEGLSEIELVAHMKDLAGMNRAPRLEFLGGGAYRHFIPATVDAVLSRGEFYTSYTPYQPEISQGNLQAIWEYQSMIAGLVGMDVSNASLYDGATAAAEAMLMCVHTLGRREILVSKTVHPHTRAVLATYARASDLCLKEINFDRGAFSPKHLATLLSEKTAGVIMQSPNFFGIIEDYADAEKLIHEMGALFVATFTEALSLGMLKPPGACGADMVAGEGQSFGISLSYGGPGLGIIACREALMRKLPGRIVGRTRDAEGCEGYVLTLQTREQHIRREGATSNICSNHALCALAASVYLATLGKRGIGALAVLNYHKAHYAKKEILSIRKGSTDKKKFTDLFPLPFFNEFVIGTHRAARLAEKLALSGIAAGIPLEEYYPEMKNCLLVCVTEMHTKADIDRLIEALS